MPALLSRLPILAALVALTACSTAPVPQHTAKPAPATTAPAAAKVNPITRLPPQTKPVPAPADRPAFGTQDFNTIKDAAPDAPVDVSQIPDAEPVEEPLAKYGNQNPYTVLGETYQLLPTAKGFTQTGTASWYGKKFHGLKTSSGEKYDMYGMTAAHRNLPLPTYVRVTNTDNGKTVIVKVNDRGPFHSERVMDLSYAAAVKLDILKTGTATVRIDAIDPAEFQRKLGKTGKPARPATTDASDEPPRFFVQIGAFGSITNATALQSKLLDLVYAPVVIASSGSPNTINRVQVGPFFTREDAEKVSEIIRGNNLGTPIIVKK